MMSKSDRGLIVKNDAATHEYLVRVDRLFLIVLWLLFALSLGLSPIHDTWSLALTIGLVLALIPSIFIITSPGALVTRLSVAVALMAMCALHVQQAMGMTELHFGFFVALAFLLCYRDWRVIVTAAGVVAVHHLSFNYLQEWGYGVICFSEPSFNRVLIHAAYVVVESGVLAYLAVLLRNESASAAASNVIILDNLNTVQIVNNRVQGGINAIVAASSNIAKGSHELSTRTQEQSSKLKNASTSIQAFTAAIHSTTDNVQQANVLVTSASVAAAKGGEVVSQAVQTMTSIESRSRRIVDIIDLINGIAFQTNILALNASVEAARAGEQGRGFSVVASEVRSLAQRSADAAKDIKLLLDSTVEEVGTGTLLVHEAGQAMTRIVASVDQVVAIMAQIADATRNQNEGIEGIRTIVEEMDIFTGKNIELVQAFSGAAQHSHANAKEVLETMARLQRPALAVQ